MGREVWRGGCQGHQADCRGQRQGLRVPEAVRYQGLKSLLITHHSAGQGMVWSGIMHQGLVLRT